MAQGQPQLLNFAKELAGKVYKPAYADWTVLAHVGNTDGWMKAVLTLCNPGEGVLTSVWTYPSALACMKPYDISPVPVGMDGEGMCADALREVLSGWDAEVRGMPRPHVMYTVPVGQNPTGATMGSQRKKDIYDICVEYDIIIVEDDPYYFLQEGPYHPPSHSSRTNKARDPLTLESYIDGLAPSYLRFDYQGRVIRLDTFSKTIAPGCRMGWFTCNPKFAERLERQAETSTQAPCGFGQALVISLLDQWKFDGFIRWTQGLQTQYTIRRDFIIDRFAEEFDLQSVKETEIDCFKGRVVYTAYPRSRSTLWMSEKSSPLDRKPLLSFIPPTSGMFVWLKLDLEHHPKSGVMTARELELALWTDLAEAGVLFGPGQMFAADETSDESELGMGHFRISFSNAEFRDIQKAVSIFARVVVEFFKS